jgi:hypothetical protein
MLTLWETLRIMEQRPHPTLPTERYLTQLVIEQHYADYLAQLHRQNHKLPWEPIRPLKARLADLNAYYMSPPFLRRVPCGSSRIPMARLSSSPAVRCTLSWMQRVVAPTPVPGVPSRFRCLPHFLTARS